MKAYAKIMYNRLFRKHLLVTNTLVSGSLMGLGDYLQQNLERYNAKTTGRPHDWLRTGRMATIGLIAGPFVHGWYKMLDSVLVGTTRITVAKKVAIDQLVASPSLLAGFFLGMGALEGKPFKHCVQELKDKFVFVYLIDCCFWPPVQTINFFYLPPNLRVAYVSSAVLVWNVFLSYIKHKDYAKDGNSLSAVVEVVDSSIHKKVMSEKTATLCEQPKCIEYTK